MDLGYIAVVDCSSKFIEEFSGPTPPSSPHGHVQYPVGPVGKLAFTGAWKKSGE
jgi:hypothetical protein